MIIGKNKGKKYVFGDKVKVKVISASKETCQVDFELIKEQLCQEKVIVKKEQYPKEKKDRLSKKEY